MPSKSDDSNKQDNAVAIKSSGEWPVRPMGVLSERSEPDDDTVVVNVPSIGLWKGSFGLIIFGPMIILVAVVAVGRILIEDGSIGVGMLTWFVLLGLAGAVMTLFAQFLGLRAWRLTFANDGSITLGSRTILGGKSTTFHAKDVESIHIGEAPFTTGNKPMVRLEVQCATRDKPWVLMTARPEIEVQWVAAVLSEAVGRHASS